MTMIAGIFLRTDLGTRSFRIEDVVAHDRRFIFTRGLGVKVSYNEMKPNLLEDIFFIIRGRHEKA
jgi:aldehyde:ferredoxin oxidoreductase